MDYMITEQKAPLAPLGRPHSNNLTHLSTADRIGQSGRSRLATLTGIQVLGTGSYAPEQIVTNHDLADLGCDEQWIIQRTGIRQRRHAPAGQTTTDVAYEAAVRCLENAQVSPDQVDMIVLGTMTSDMAMPTSACLLQKRLGCLCPALEVNAACSGFMYALVTGMQYVKSGCSRCALVVGADLMSRTVNPKDEKTYPLFGDGGGAVLLGRGDATQGLVSYTLGAEGDLDYILAQPGCGTAEPLTHEALDAGRQYIQMEGRAVFKWAVRVMHDSARDVLTQANLTTDDIDLVVLHQANVRIIDAALDDLGISRDRAPVNLDRYGNTSAGSMPLVLDEAYREGRIKRGDNVLLCGFGGGLSWGTAVMKW